MFFFFRWVFVERYSAEEAKNYAILIALSVQSLHGGLRLSSAEIFQTMLVAEKFTLTALQCPLKLLGSVRTVYLF